MATDPVHLFMAGASCVPALALPPLRGTRRAQGRGADGPGPASSSRGKPEAEEIPYPALPSDLGAYEAERSLLRSLHYSGASFGLSLARAVPALILLPFPPFAMAATALSSVHRNGLRPRHRPGCARPAKPAPPGSPGPARGEGVWS